MAGSRFSDAELERYARHIVLHDIGGAGQVRLRDAKILVVGAGGLGSAVLLYLAAAGIGHLSVVDDDKVTLSNLQRQVLHGTPDIGRLKTKSANAALARLNPEIGVTTHALRLDDTNAASLIAGCDAVLDGSDNFQTRAVVNAACVATRVPLIMGAIGTWDGMVSLFRPWAGTPCWECVFPDDSRTGAAPSCADHGVLGSLAGTIGTLMATECVKLVTGAGAGLENEMLLYDAYGSRFRTLKVKPNPDCPACAAIRQST